MKPLLILRTATGLLNPLLLLLSVYLLLTGHHEPGGGFIGGLVAASAFALLIFSHGVERARAALMVEPRRLLAAGLLVSGGSGVAAFFSGRPFMASSWGSLPVPGLGLVKVGTPLVFDVGVYLLVIGVTLLIAFSLAEEE